MAIALTASQARRLRLRAQRLETRAVLDPALLVRSLGAVQAQDPTAAQLAVRVRTEGLTADAVEQARTAERTVVRTWAMRGTLHLVPAADLRWILRLLGPAMIRKARRRHRELGLTEDVYARAATAMRHLLEAQGPRTRAQIAACLAQHDLPAEGQVVPHLLSRASLSGIICFGPMACGQATYTLLEAWLHSHGQEVDDPVVELARRYMAAHAPATPVDFQTWSGLSAAQARRAFAGLAAELVQIEVAGIPMWLPGDRAGAGQEASAAGQAVKMLGAFDTYLLGYRTRDLDVPPALLKRVHPGGGIIRPAILVDGRAVATWSRRQAGRRLRIAVAPFTLLAEDIRAAIIEEVADIGRFLGTEAECTIGLPQSGPHPPSHQNR